MDWQNIRYLHWWFDIRSLGKKMGNLQMEPHGKNVNNINDLTNINNFDKVDKNHIQTQQQSEPTGSFKFNCQLI